MNAFSFDPTISAGSLIAGISVVISIAIAAFKNGNAVRDGIRQIGELDTRLASVETKVDAIALLQHDMHNSHERDADFEARIRVLEQTTERRK